MGAHRLPSRAAANETTPKPWMRERCARSAQSPAMQDATSATRTEPMVREPAAKVEPAARHPARPGAPPVVAGRGDAAQRLRQGGSPVDQADTPKRPRAEPERHGAVPGSAPRGGAGRSGGDDALVNSAVRGHDGRPFTSKDSSAPRSHGRPPRGREGPAATSMVRRRSERRRAPGGDVSQREAGAEHRDAPDIGADPRDPLRMPRIAPESGLVPEARRRSWTSLRERDAIRDPFSQGAPAAFGDEQLPQPRQSSRPPRAGPALERDQTPNEAAQPWRQ